MTAVCENGRLLKFSAAAFKLHPIPLNCYELFLPSASDAETYKYVWKCHAIKQL